ncbi:uncharacterized protein LAJ45_00658 [Morchella importuna]|uniref:uncharacterized protein n=1 Tax=Morchella importuna TaxID=1174673 RepID=UPI001E8E94EF|nr:uncharacterized protein LAJ45_00658 [Morchella importuna]KAH8155648.1 hypothetical protein LAJ45_00658 [Morchella importuna]
MQSSFFFSLHGVATGLSPLRCLILVRYSQLGVLLSKSPSSLTPPEPTVRVFLLPIPLLLALKPSRRQGKSAFSPPPPPPPPQLTDCSLAFRSPFQTNASPSRKLHTAQ